MADTPEATDQMETQFRSEFEEDGTADVIAKAIDAMEQEADQEDQWSQPVDTEQENKVAPGEGRKILDDIEEGKVAPDAAKEADAAEAKADPDPEAEEDKGAEGKDGDAADDAKAKTEADESAETEIQSASIADLITEIPDTPQRAEVVRRLGEAQRVSKLFEGRESEFQVHGMQDQAQVVKRLLDLNAQAQADPAAYVGWVIGQTTTGDDQGKVLEKIAASMGYTVTKAETEDDDPFMTDGEREARADAAEMRKRLAALEGGEPPEQAAAKIQTAAVTMIDTLREEIDLSTGQVKRPHWDTVQGEIAQRIKAHAAANPGVPPTIAQVGEMYDAAVSDLAAKLGGGQSAAPNSAAAQARAVAPNDGQAARGERSKRASKMIDGSGQGASRHPAPGGDDDLHSIIAGFAADIPG